jgi:hypothetical protein
MSRKVFFSFHYERDAWRAGNVRNSGVIAKDDEVGFIDGADWETIEREGDAAIKKWIHAQLKDTSVTVVLIGAETASREWVLYEIRESWKRGNAVIGVGIHGIRDSEKKTDRAGANPLDHLFFTDGAPLSSVCSLYDWVADDGRAHLGEWVEGARKDRDGLKMKKTLVEDAAHAAKSFATIATTGPTIIHNPAKPWAA